MRKVSSVILLFIVASVGSPMINKASATETNVKFSQDSSWCAPLFPNCGGRGGKI